MAFGTQLFAKKPRGFSSPAGPRLVVVNNADGTYTANWSNWTRSGLDHYDLEISATGSAPWTPVSQNITPELGTETGPFNDITPYYWRLVAEDGSDATIAISNIFGPLTITGDSEAAALITVLKGTDGWAGDATKETAIHSLFANVRADGYLSKIKELFLPIFANSTVNRRKWITRGQMTYQNNGGAFSHNADGISKTGNAYLDPAYAPANLGQSSAANGTGVFYKTFPTQDTSVACGVQPSGLPQTNIFPNYTGNTSFFRFGTEAAAGSFSVNTSALAAGMLLGVRTSASNAAVYHYRWSNNTFSTVGTTTGLSGTAFPAATHNKFWFAQNVAGTASSISSTPIYGGVETTDLSAAEAELLGIEIQTLLTSWGIL